MTSLASAAPMQCVACTDSFGPPDNFTQPCVGCSAIYCRRCIHHQFRQAIIDPTSMPPKCCIMIQLHVGFVGLAENEKQEFKNKFEEWISGDKIYCPVPSCSTYIPDRLIMHPRVPVPTVNESLRWALDDIAKAIISNTPAEMRHKLPPLPEMQETARSRVDPPTLNRLIGKAKNYSDPGKFMADLDYLIDVVGVPFTVAWRIRENAYNAICSAPVRITSQEALSMCLPKIFACPKCSIGICGECKQIAHVGRQCDNTHRDYEKAILKKFRSKRCPNCDQGVEKVYGCHHVQCLCGCHWCWRCGQSQNQCDGDCSDDEFEDEGEDSDVASGAGNEDSDAMDLDTPEPTESRIIQTSEPSAGIATPTNTNPQINPTALVRAENVTMPTTTLPVADTERANRAPPLPDLDADDGRDRFGEEPEDDYHAVLGCLHRLHPVYAGGRDRTIQEDTEVICNRCFKGMKPQVHCESARARGATATTAGSATTSSTMVDYLSYARQAAEWTTQASGAGMHDDRPGADLPWSCYTCNALFCGACRDFLYDKDKVF